MAMMSQERIFEIEIPNEIRDPTFRLGGCFDGTLCLSTSGNAVVLELDLPTKNYFEPFQMVRGNCKMRAFKTERQH